MELATTNAEQAKAFYGALFGWSYEDMPIGEGRYYTMFKLRGRHVAACFPQSEQQRAEAPRWASYVAVDDVDSAAKAATAAGASILAPPFDVMGEGRMATLKDPTGAVLSLWQAGRHPGAGLVGEPGAPIWNELMVRDLAKAKAFYAALFGWTAEEMRGPMGPYVVFSNQGEPAAGLMQPPKEGIPPCWLVYFGVADCKATVARCRELGGVVDGDPMEVPDVGWIAVLADPQHAPFAILQPVRGG